MNDNIYDKIAKLASNYGAHKVVLFGSRARADHHAHSDMDLAIYGMPCENQGRFYDDLENVDTLLKIDICYVTQCTNPVLLEHIKRDGVIIMDKFHDKYTKLTQVVARLKESIDEFNQIQSLSVRGGAIQRFEFCFELAWKTMREKLLEEGFVDINSPKSTMRIAYANQMIRDEESWMNLLQDRNAISHIYDDETAKLIYQRIENIYYSLFIKLLDELK